MVQICRLENVEHKNMKQVPYSGKYSLSAGTAHQSHLLVMGEVSILLSGIDIFLSIP